VKMPVIATIAVVLLPAIATFSATAPLAQSNRYAQLQHSAGAAVRGLNMDAVPSLDHDAVRHVQQALQRKGFDPGPIDGILGPRTRQAVRNFQDRYGIEAGGDIDNQTLFALGAVELAGNAGSTP
jgi:peptidoglycan hydrolase-like protein with peptidoglycan-binding domain